VSITASINPRTNSAIDDFCRRALARNRRYLIGVSSTVRSLFLLFAFMTLHYEPFERTSQLTIDTNLRLAYNGAMQKNYTVDEVLEAWWWWAFWQGEFQRLLDNFERRVKCQPKPE
jgi:hypothetical protein